MRNDFNIVRALSNAFSISEETAIAGLVLTGLLLVFAAGVFLHVVLVSYERKISLRSAMKNALSALWAIPILAVLACFGFRTADYFQRAEQQAEIVQREKTEETAAKPAKAEPEFIPGKEAPAWTKFQQPGTTDVVTTASGDHDVITARGATIAEAERKLAAIARKRLIARITDKERRADDSSMIAHADDRSIASHAVEKRFEQPGTEKVRVSRPGSQDKEYSTKAYQVYWKLDFSEKARQEIRREAAVPRLWIVGGLVALLTMIAAAVATYLRVDARTEGKYRFRLKSATTVFLVAAGLLLTAVLPFG